MGALKLLNAEKNIGDSPPLNFVMAFETSYFKNETSVFPGNTKKKFKLGIDRSQIHHFHRFL